MRKPVKLSRGELIGVVAPCWALEKEKAVRLKEALEKMGYPVRFGENVFRNTYGFAASPEERAADFNAMARDPKVRMILFGGGEVGNEILPLIDYEALERDPKILLSYSDGTSILEAVFARSGICTYYGQSPKSFLWPADYNQTHFENAILSSKPYAFPKGSAWRALTSGKGEGLLLGGYLQNFAMMLEGRYFKVPDEPCLLFLEDHIQFNGPGAVSKYFSHMEQSGLFSRVTGLLWGHYSAEAQPWIDGILTRIGQRYGIPVLCCEDFGHGKNQGILPIGIAARLDAINLSLTFLEGTVG